MYQRTQTSMMSASNERRRYMGSRAIGLVIRRPWEVAEFYGSGPQMHRNPLVFSGGSGQLAHCIQCSTCEKPRSGLTLLLGVGVDCAENTLRQGDVDPCGLIPKLAGVDVDDRPSPVAKAPLLLQLFNRCWCRECFAIIQKPFQMQQDRLARVGKRLV